MEQPVYYWDPSIAVSGLALYTGDLFPEWKGNLLVGSLKFMQVQRLVLKDGEVIAHEVLADDIGERVRDVRQGPEGAVYVLTDDSNGRLVRIEPK
jgi:glucose/arabinose dehydrogenase